jgi:ferredoxin, 2Fe-2S
MTVNVEWKTAEGVHAGLVADGTYLLDAARRHGIVLPTECDRRGECDTCAVVVETGAELLSAPTEAERQRLGEERLAAGERLACQAKAERGGDISLRPVPAAERAETTEETASDFKEEFKRLPLRKKIATLAGLEAEVAYETLVSAVNLPFDIMGKGLDLLAGRGRRLSQAERAQRVPTVPTPPPSSEGDPGSEGPAI